MLTINVITKGGVRYLPYKLNYMNEEGIKVSARPILVLTCFILDSLQTFDAIIGLDFLRQIGANIDLEEAQIRFDSGTERLKFYQCKNVNHINLNDQEIPENVKGKFKELFNINSKVYADANESIPYNTNVIATIRTSTNDPIYSKSYPYPMRVADFVNTEIKELLKNNVKRPSRSPYHSPIWVVDKKGTDDKGNKKKEWSLISKNWMLSQ